MRESPAKSVSSERVSGTSAWARNALSTRPERSTAKIRVHQISFRFGTLRVRSFDLFVLFFQTHVLFIVCFSSLYVKFSLGQVLNCDYHFYCDTYKRGRDNSKLIQGFYVGCFYQ